MYVHATACMSNAQGGQKRWVPLQLELQMVITPLRWVAETELKSSRRAVNTLKHKISSPSPIPQASGLVLLGVS